MPSYCLDNFKHPYIRFEDRFLWPSVHLIDPLPEEVDRIRSILRERWPGFGDHFALWQNDIFSGNQKYLNFICQTPEMKKWQMMLELRVLVGYAGGAEITEIIRPAEQNRSPEFLTDRIYFKAGLLPIEELDLDRGQVKHVDILTFAEILEASRYSLNRDQKEIWTTALFDAIDYSKILERLVRILSGLEPWKLGMLFPPVLIERMTFCLNVLTLNHAEHMSEAFRDLIEHIQEDDLQHLKSREDWKRYNAAWSLERIISRSGNPHWVFTSYPNEMLRGK
jgi:hypothetical protein